MTIPAIQFTDLKANTSEVLQKFTAEKFARLSKFAVNITKIQVIFKINKSRHLAEAKIHIPKTEFYAEAESENMYKSVDMLLNKLSRQLAAHKEKVTHHKGSAPIPTETEEEDTTDNS